MALARKLCQVILRRIRVSAGDLSLVIDRLMIPEIYRGVSWALWAGFYLVERRKFPFPAVHVGLEPTSLGALTHSPMPYLQVH